MKFTILISFAYLLGSVPFAYIAAIAHGKNLYQIGSGNIGATNLARALGKKWGYACFAFDVSKGLIPMLIGTTLINAQPAVAEIILWLAAGTAAIIGHIFPVYLKFKGGKGVSTSFGVALGLWPYFTLSAAVALIAWIIVVLIWRYVSLASVIASVIFPIALICLIIFLEEWRFQNLWPLFVAAIGIPVMVIIRHRENIKRIASGTESKIFTK
ncbi:MAG: glycerol-3-phosphate 1-O-acyltransferase PlsY [Sedimentisphaerales bacterium]|nr:glycerol-3-phosphate 1-O-acyltransferase PlsY [Sedimentisphaerales bacterium]